MKVGNAVHEFIRVQGGVRQDTIRLRTSINVDGELYTNEMRLYPETIKDLEEFLNLAENLLGRVVGAKIVEGRDL